MFRVSHHPDISSGPRNETHCALDQTKPRRSHLHRKRGELIGGSQHLQSREEEGQEGERPRKEQERSVRWARVRIGNDMFLMKLWWNTRRSEDSLPRRYHQSVQQQLRFRKSIQILGSHQFFGLPYFFTHALEFEQCNELLHDIPSLLIVTGEPLLNFHEVALVVLGIESRIVQLICGLGTSRVEGEGRFFVDDFFLELGHETDGLEHLFFELVLERFEYFSDFLFFIIDNLKTKGKLLLLLATSVLPVRVIRLGRVHHVGRRWRVPGVTHRGRWIPVHIMIRRRKHFVNIFSLPLAHRLPRPPSLLPRPWNTPQIHFGPVLKMLRFFNFLLSRKARRHGKSVHRLTVPVRVVSVGWVGHGRRIGVHVRRRHVWRHHRRVHVRWIIGRRRVVVVLFVLLGTTWIVSLFTFLQICFSLNSLPFFFPFPPAFALKTLLPPPFARPVAMLVLVLTFVAFFLLLRRAGTFRRIVARVVLRRRIVRRVLGPVRRRVVVGRRRVLGRGKSGTGVLEVLICLETMGTWSS